MRFERYESGLLLPRRERFRAPPSSRLCSAGIHHVWPIGGGDGDPYINYVINLHHCNGADGSTAALVDSSPYARATDALQNCALETTNPLWGSSSVLCAGGGSFQYSAHSTGTEGHLASQNFSQEMSIDAAASQNHGYPILWAIGTTFAAGSVWVFLSHAGNAAWTGKLTAWVFNNSAVAPLVIGTTDLRGAGRVHVSLTRDGSNFALHANGILEGTGTYAGSVGTSSGRQLGGLSTASNVQFEGIWDEWRETVGIARYPVAGNYTPQSAEWPNN